MAAWEGDTRMKHPLLHGLRTIHNPHSPELVTRSLLESGERYRGCEGVRPRRGVLNCYASRDPPPTSEEHYGGGGQAMQSKDNCATQPMSSRQVADTGDAQWELAIPTARLDEAIFNHVSQDQNQERNLVCTKTPRATNAPDTRARA